MGASGEMLQCRVGKVEQQANRSKRRKSPRHTASLPYLKTFSAGTILRLLFSAAVSIGPSSTYKICATPAKPQFECSSRLPT